MKPIRFGTDGWRGVIADDFTYQRVAVVCGAIAEYLAEIKKDADGVAIGFDNRFGSEAFAELAATIFSSYGIRVLLSEESIPTPLVSYIVHAHKLGGGIAVTASHNPPQYNGIKFKSWLGGSATPEMTHELERRANLLLPVMDVDELRRKGPRARLISREDFVPEYIEHVLSFVDREAIRARAPRVVFDSMYGSSFGVLDRALREAGCSVRVIHGERNPAFGGVNPEPVPENLGALQSAMTENEVDVGIASDGDGDRIAGMTEHGEYVTPHQIFALLLMHLVEDKGMRGGVVKTVSTTNMIDRLTEKYDLPLTVTPIGFKYIAQLMMEDDILIGGEESGGIGIRGHIPERDATLAALLLIEMMAVRQSTMAGLLEQLRESVGPHSYQRIDMHLERPITPEEFTALRQRVPAQLMGVAVREVDERDGLKMLLMDGSWLLLRASGTEPVLRVYAEAATPEQVSGLLDSGAAMLPPEGLRQVA